jgi:endonuclease-3
MVDVRRRAGAVNRKLISAFGIPTWRHALPPIDELVSTILSQNTNDLNRDRAFHALRRRFSSWPAVRDAPPRQVIQAIRVAGLANQKGPRIQQVLRDITRERGNLDLRFLKDLPVEQARTWLMRFRGVGPKTAAIVLLFALGKPAFPVDTHVHRVTRRLGLIPEKTSREHAHELLEQLVPPEIYYPFHINLIEHGRAVCHARAPECDRCVLQDHCMYYATVFQQPSAPEDK